jgi:hypothetical protein
MKKAIYLLLGCLMCTACTRLDHELHPDAAEIQFSTSAPVRICTYQQGQYQALLDVATLKLMFRPLAASDIDGIQFLQIDGTHFMEATSSSGSRYIELIPSQTDNSLLLGSRMTACNSGGVCKNCKYTGGSNCGCGNGSNDCSYDEMTVTW